LIFIVIDCILLNYVKFKTLEFDESDADALHVEFTDSQVIDILNNFIFWLFVIYLLLLNLLLLVVFPLFVKTPLLITEDT